MTCVRTTVPRSLAVVAALAATTMALGACGGSKDDSGGSNATATTAAVASPCPQATAPPPKNDSLGAPPMTIDPAKKYTATMQTSCGTMTFDLLPATAGVDVNNFVYLARSGFYDGTVFHRIIDGFMIQGGDPTGADPKRAGTGGPGYKYTGSVPSAGQYQVGSLAMANSGSTFTNGSQFFIVSGPKGVSLPPNYSLFGQLTSGEDVLAKIASVPVAAGPTGEKSSPKSPVVVDKVTITES